MGTEVQSGVMKTALEMDGGDGCTTMQLHALTCTSKNS